MSNRIIERPDRSREGQPATTALHVTKNVPFFLKSGASGSIAAGFTHFIMVPIDVVKTRMQLTPSSGTARITTRGAFWNIRKSEGWRGLTLGLGPTNYGYLTQGFFKYSLYELFKAKFPGVIGQEMAERNAFWLYLTAGMAAEAIADVFLTPFEAIRIRVVSQPQVYRPLRTAGGIGHIVRTEGITGLYRGFLPLLGKQVPYTAVKLATFEMTEELFYDHLITTPRSQLSGAQQLVVTTISGFIGGVASAVASHPADTLLTKVNMGKIGIVDALKMLASPGTVWAGLAPRMGMVGVLAALQLLVYDATKVTLFGLPTSQGIKKHKESG